MSENFLLGWMKNFSGIKIAPKTFSSQVITDKGTLDNVLRNLYIKTSDKIYKQSVETYNDIATTYPNPENGWTVRVDNEGNYYRYDSNFLEWVLIESDTSIIATDNENGLLSSEDHKKLISSYEHSNIIHAPSNSNETVKYERGFSDFETALVLEKETMENGIKSDVSGVATSPYISANAYRGLLISKELELRGNFNLGNTIQVGTILDKINNIFKTEYSYSCNATPGENWGDVSASIKLIGNCIKISVGGKRLNAVSSGDLTNEVVLTATFENDGKISKKPPQTNSVSAPKGFGDVFSVVFDSINSFSVYFTGSVLNHNENYEMTTHFLCPVCIDLSSY